MTAISILKTFFNSKIMALASIQGAIYTLFLEYVFSDFQFAGFLAVLVVVDTSLGLYFSLRKKDFDPSVFWGFFEKIFIYVSILVAGHVANNYTIEGAPAGTLSFLKNTLYSGMVIRELLSIIQFAGQKYPEMLREVLIYFRSYQDDKVPTNQQKK